MRSTTRRTTGRRRAARALAGAIVALVAAHAFAGGYWACRDGRWIAEGTPGHPEPARACGSARETPRTAAACAAQGGQWGPIGIFPAPVCSLRAHDAGRACGDSGECEGACIAVLTKSERDALMRAHGTPLARDGTCSARVPVVGCIARVDRGAVRGIVCLD